MDLLTDAGTFIVDNFVLVCIITLFLFIIGLRRNSYFIVGVTTGVATMLPFLHQYA